MKKQQRNPGIMFVLLFLLSFRLQEAITFSYKTFLYAFGGDFGCVRIDLALDSEVNEPALCKYSGFGILQRPLSLDSFDASSFERITYGQIVPFKSFSKN